MGRNPATQKDAFDVAYDIAVDIVKIKTSSKPSKNRKQKKEIAEREK